MDDRLYQSDLANARSLKFHSFGMAPTLVERLAQNGADPYGEPVFKGKITKSRDLRPSVGAPFIPSYQKQVRQTSGIHNKAHKNQLWQLEAKQKMARASDPSRIESVAKASGQRYSLQAQPVSMPTRTELMPVKKAKPKPVPGFSHTPLIKGAQHEADTGDRVYTSLVPKN